MVPGNIIVRKCPICSTLFFQPTLNSGNALGARWWTDGKMEAPMFPAMLSLVKCRKCKSLFWIENADKVEEMKPFEMDRYSSDTMIYDSPTWSDYINFTKSHVLTIEQEKYVRMQAWWGINDFVRYDTAQKELDSVVYKFFISNLEALHNILNELDIEERLIKAEVLRELGRFNDCLVLLKFSFSEDLLHAVSVIGDLCRQCKTHVTELTEN